LNFYSFKRQMSRQGLKESASSQIFEFAKQRTTNENINVLNSHSHKSMEQPPTTRSSKRRTVLAQNAKGGRRHEGRNADFTLM